MEKIVKTRLKATLQRCTRDPLIQSQCRTLLPLVTDPWGHQTLKAIFAGSYVSDEESEYFFYIYSNEAHKECLKGLNICSFARGDDLIIGSNIIEYTEEKQISRN